MPQHIRSRAALSLVELIIAMGILLAVVASAMDVVIGTYSTTAMTEAKDRLNQEATDIMNVMSDDLAQSTWLYFDTASPGAPFLDTSATALQGTTDDSTRRYYPYVQLQDNGAAVGGMGADFPHTARLPGMVALPVLPSNLPGAATDATTLFGTAGRAAFLRSFFARSQELLFIKLTGTPWTADPGAQAPNALLFPNGDWSGTDLSATNHTAINVLFPSGWQEVYDAGGNVTGYASRQLPLQPPYGVRLTATDVRMVNNEPQIRPNYETIDVPDYTPHAAGTPDQDPREYTYAVVPSPLGGLGRLVRAYTVRMASVAAPVAGTDPGQFITPIPTANTIGLRVDKVLSDNCVRIVMDTYRTEPRVAGQAGLGVYDIRVRLYMARRSSASSKLVLYRTLESVLTMRGRTSEVDRANDATKLGATPIDLTY